MTLPKGLVWITGASSGIGWATALHLARHGYQVAASARNANALKALQAKDDHITAYPLDVADPLARERIYHHIRQDLGPVDVLINNAGYALRGAIEDVPPHMMRDIYDINVFAPIELAKLVLPEMRQRQEGRIINVSSVVGKVTPPLNGAYASTKYALESLSDALRMEVAPWSIKVILVEPGPIRTNFGATALRESDPLLQQSDSPYAKFYRQFIADPPFKKHHYWGPASVAEVMRRAIEAANPKARYPVHPVTLLMPFLRAHLPDWIGDRIFSEKYGIRTETGS